MNMMISYQELVRTFPNKTPAISKLELVLDIYPSLSLILRYIYCLVFQGASSHNNFELLLRELHDAPVPIPPIGINPFC